MSCWGSKAALQWTGSLCAREVSGAYSSENCRQFHQEEVKHMAKPIKKIKVKKNTNYLGSLLA